jgi:hypothetical protein
VTRELTAKEKGHISFRVKTETTMAKTRSPQYPAIGLREAIEKVSAVYSRDYQGPTQRGVIASHMGYNSLNGKSLGVLSAVGKYGLLEGRGSEYRVSDLAVRILAHQPGDPERVTAIQEAASIPELFQELDKRFANGKISDQSIRSYLIMRKFIPAAADAVIRSYRETKGLVEEESVGHNLIRDEVSEVPRPFMEGAPSRRRDIDASEHRREGKVPSTNRIRAGLVDAGWYEVDAMLVDIAGFDRLIKILQVNRMLFEGIELQGNIFDPETSTWSKASDANS